MGLMDRIKKVTGTNDSYDDSYDDDYYNGFDNYDEIEDDSDMQMAGGAQASMNTTQTNMGAGMNAGMGGGISLSGVNGANIKMQVVRPQNYDGTTASQIANHLLNKCTVVLNLENATKETSRRLIDFLSGVAYSIGGSLKKIATNAYVITPSNVDVDEPQMKQNARRPEPEPEEKPAAHPLDDFSDFN